MGSSPETESEPATKPNSPRGQLQGRRNKDDHPIVLALGDVSQLILARSKTLEIEIQGKTIDEEDLA